MKKTFSVLVFAVAFAGALGSQSARAEAVKVFPKNLQVGETCAQVYTLNYNDESPPVHWGKMVGKYKGAQTPWWQSLDDLPFGDPVGSAAPDDSLAREWRDAYGFPGVPFAYGQEGVYATKDGKSGGYFIYDGSNEDLLGGYDSGLQKKIILV